MRYICNAAFDNNSKDADGKSLRFTRGDEYTGKKEEIEALLKSGLIVSEEDFKNLIKNDLKGFDALKKQIETLQMENAELRKKLGIIAKSIPTVEPIPEKKLNADSRLASLGNKTRNELNGIAKNLGLDVNPRFSKEQLIDAILKADEEGE